MSLSIKSYKFHKLYPEQETQEQKATAFLDHLWSVGMNVAELSRQLKLTEPTTRSIFTQIQNNVKFYTSYMDKVYDNVVDFYDNKLGASLMKVYRDEIQVCDQNYGNCMRELKDPANDELVKVGLKQALEWKKLKAKLIADMLKAHQIALAANTKFLLEGKVHDGTESEHGEYTEFEKRYLNVFNKEGGQESTDSGEAKTPGNGNGTH